MQYAIYYDILRSGSGIEGDIASFCFGAMVGVFLLILAIKKQKTLNIVFCIIWLTGWIGIGSIGLGSVSYQHYRCTQWMRSGDYQTVEGTVTDFIKHYDRPIYEKFTVNGETFEYSSYDLSVCGFRQMTNEGGPIKEGLHVRIAYRDSRILKLEIAESQPNP